MLAVLTFEMSADDGERTGGQILAIVGTELVAVFVIGHLFRFLIRRNVTSSTRSSTVVCLTIVAFAIELFTRSALHTYLPMEQLLLVLIRNALLGLLVFGHDDACRRVACSLSLFLTIFASTLSSRLWLQVFLAFFAILGIFWLCGHHWERLRGRLVASSSIRRSRSTRIVSLVIPLALIFVLPMTGISTRALPGFMPSSGGQEWSLETAQGGVGDGDALVAGTENIQSFAAIENAPFLNSHEPSLYDMFDDSYNEPVNVDKQERAISINNDRSSQPSERQLAESQSVGKEFSTVRKPGRPDTKQVNTRHNEAVLFVKGRVPLHLRLNAFDRYDGRDWSEESLSGGTAPLTMEQVNNRPWLQVPRMDEGTLFAGPENHALKIIRLKSNRIPTPNQLLGVHIDKLDRADFFCWAQPDILRMDREQLPSLTVIHVQSRIADVRKLEAHSLQAPYGPERYRQIVAGIDSQRIEQLACEWTKDASHGWPQIQAVIDRLRRDYKHDHEARPPDDCLNTAVDFLFETRRGPDYQFATAAVMLLRSLGYSARLVSGFHVDANRFDRRAQHTPVLPDDVHVWAEVATSSGTWIPIEPTPGYELLGPMPTLFELLGALLFRVWDCLVSQGVWVLIGSSLTAFFLYYRKSLVDRIETLVWSLRRPRNQRTLVLHTLRLIEHRTQRWGGMRPQWQSVPRWVNRLTIERDSHEQHTLNHFGRLADWALFAPEQTTAFECDCTRVCVQTVQIVSPSRIAKLVRKPMSPTRP